MGQPINIAVMDAGRNLVAFHRMDGAWVASIDIAIDRAFTSAGQSDYKIPGGSSPEPAARAARDERLVLQPQVRATL